MDSFKKPVVAFVLILLINLVKCNDTGIKTDQATIPGVNLPRFISDGESIVQNRYIVQFIGPPAASVTAQRRESVSALDLERKALQQQESFDIYIQDKQVPLQTTQRFLQLFNGVSFTISNDQDLTTIANAPNVKSIFPLIKQQMFAPVERMNINTTYAKTVPQFAHTLTKVDQVRKLYPELTGQSVKVGVIDSGMDYKHPAFAVPGQTCNKFKGPGCRVQFGFDFVGDQYDGSFDNKAHPVIDSDPFDCNGHGTHVGIIGGYEKDKLQGVAPQVTFGAYKIFGCEGGTDSVLVLSALEAAYRDGMALVNLSLGGSIVGTDSPYAQAVDTLSENNVYVIAAASNDGDQGLFQIKAPSIASRAISVASFDNSHTYETKAKVSHANGGFEFPYGYNRNTQRKFDVTRNYKVVHSPPSANASIADGCDKYATNVFAGAVALIRRGGCVFTSKVMHAIIAGAQGVIIYSDLPQRFRGGLIDAKVAGLTPVVFMDADDGNKLRDLIKSTNENVHVQFPDTPDFYPAKTNGKPSDFSSWGPDVNLLIKPDISAPGGLIYSAYPTALGSNYSQLSGTSMSSPYVAGLVALDVQKNGVSTGVSSFQSLVSRLSITSRPHILHDNTAESVIKVGAGMVDALSFLTNHVSVSPHKLELGDSPDWPFDRAPKVQSVSIQNNGNKTVDYLLFHTPSRSVMGDEQRNTSSLAFANVFATVTFSNRVLRVLPGETKSITVSVALPLMTKEMVPGHWIFSGYVTFKSSTFESKDLNIPYAIMGGDFSTMPIMSSKSETQPILTNGFALNPLLRNYAKVYTSEQVPPVFSLTPEQLNEVPVLKFSTLFPIRMLGVAMFDAHGDKPLVGYAIKGEHLSPIKDGYMELNGKVTQTLKSDVLMDVPNGEYFLTIQVARPAPLDPYMDLKLINLWTSPNFRIDRNKFKH